jgi:hypothetical protein
LSGRHILKISTPAGCQAPRPLIGSFRYSVDAEKKLVVVAFAKKLTVQDIERYAKLLQLDPSFRPTFSEVVDLTQVEELDLQADEFLTFWPTKSILSPTKRSAPLWSELPSRTTLPVCTKFCER